MHVFPAIDLRDGAVVRLWQGDYARQTTYGHDPVAQAQRFEQAGASWLHVVDLDGARAGRLMHGETIAAICEATRLRVEVGGGIREQSSIDRLLRAGVQRVVLGTAALKDWAWFETMMGNPTYRGRLVLGLDAKNGQLAISGWEQTTQTAAIDIAREVSDWPLAAIVYTDIATDGTLTGPNLDALKAMTESTHVPIVASGGVGSIEDLQALSQLPLQGVIVGRALYDGAFTLEQALAAVEGG